MLLIVALVIPKPLVYAKTGDWSTYLGNNARSGFNGSETIITSATAPTLKMHWKLNAGAKITTQPVEANNLIYWGSWDGYEHATNPATGKDVWTANLGTAVSQTTKIGMTVGNYYIRSNTLDDGSVNAHVKPCPGCDSTQILPPCI